MNSILLFFPFYFSMHLFRVRVSVWACVEGEENWLWLNTAALFWSKTPHYCDYLGRLAYACMPNYLSFGYIIYLTKKKKKGFFAACILATFKTMNELVFWFFWKKVRQTIHVLWLMGSAFTSGRTLTMWKVVYFTI